jgi:hypothetical protein
MVKSSTRRTRKIRGGGWSIGDSLSKDAYYVPEYKATSDCAPAERPGFIQAIPNPELAQVKMAGGRRYRTRRGGSYRNCAPSKPIGSIQSNPRPDLAQAPMAGGFGCGCNKVRGGGCGAKMRGGGCGAKMRGGGCGAKMRGGGCGCGAKMRGGGCGAKMRGGSCGKMRGGTRKGSRHPRRSKRTMKGGRYFIDTTQSIGGTGPNAAPIYSSLPCEAQRAMPLNPTLPTLLADSPVPEVNVGGLKPAFIMKGGDFTNGHPLSYTAPRAGFAFTPNISQGQKLDPGQIPYQEVTPQVDNCNTASCGQALSAINK